MPTHVPLINKNANPGFLADGLISSDDVNLCHAAVGHFHRCAVDQTEKAKDKPRSEPTIWRHRCSHTTKHNTRRVGCGVKNMNRQQEQWWI